MNDSKLTDYYSLLNKTRIEDLTEPWIVFLKKQDLYLFVVAKDQELWKAGPFRNMLMGAYTCWEQSLYQLSQVVKKFEENSIDYRVIKGIGVAEAYPYPFTRMMGDFDILVGEDGHKKAGQVLESMGYQTKVYESQVIHVTYEKKDFGEIELHRRLFDKKRLNLDIGMEEAFWKDAFFQDVLGVSVKCPEPRIHLKYQLLHMFKHFKGRGIGLRFLLDIQYFSMRHRLGLIDLIDYCDCLGYGLLYRTILKVMADYMDYEIAREDQEKYLDEIPNSLVEALAKEFLEHGTYGLRDQENEKDFRYEKYLKIAKTSKLLMIQTMLFPTCKELDKNFAYAKVYPVLLPLAWIHRVLFATFSSKYSSRHKFFWFTKNKAIIDDRMQLLERFGLL